MILAICFTNFGPYHLARLRALAARLRRERRSPDRLRDRPAASGLYPWQTAAAGRAVRLDHPVPRPRPRDARRGRLCRGRCVGRSTATGPMPWRSSATPGPSRWPRLAGPGGTARPAILMSESQAIDQPRVWWKEAIKRRRVRLLRRGPGRRPAPSRLPGRARHARATGSPWATTRSTTRFYRDQADALARPSRRTARDCPERPYFLAVSRFVPEKNLSA